MHAKMTYEEWSEERREEGRAEGRADGRVLATQEALLRFWPHFMGELAPELRSMIASSTDLSQLEAAMNILAQSKSSEDATTRLRALLG